MTTEKLTLKLLLMKHSLPDIKTTREDLMKRSKKDQKSKKIKKSEERDYVSKNCTRR